MVRRNQNHLDVVLLQHRLPAGLYIRDLCVSLQKGLAVKIAAPVDEDFPLSLKSIDEITAPLILREYASILEKVRCADRKLRGVESDLTITGSDHQDHNKDHGNHAPNLAVNCEHTI